MKFLSLEDEHYILNLFGIKLKFKKTKKTTREMLNDLSNMHEFYFYQQLHQQKFYELKAKIKAGQKVKVFFAVSNLNKFGYDSIYKNMEKNDLFEPYVLILGPDYGFCLNETCINDVKESYEYFKKDYRVISAYDENFRPKNIDKLYPDILFCNDPKLFTCSIFKNDLFNKNTLTCYVPYCMNAYNDFRYNYEYPSIHHCWKQFAPTYYDYKIMLDESKYKGLNAHYYGYPKLDVYAQDIDLSKIPDKLKNGNPTIIYAPHWTIPYKGYNDKFLLGYLSYATFQLYYKLFKNLREKYQNINWVFKPHPNLVHRIHELWQCPDVIHYEEYANYIKEWDESPNGVYLNSGEYIDIFKFSDYLITDSLSFITEWLPANKPCIYLFNSDYKNPRKLYNGLANKILDSYYTCSTEDELIDTFEDIVIHKNDKKRELRERILKEELENIGYAGLDITNHLFDILTNEG